MFEDYVRQYIQKDPSAKIVCAMNSEGRSRTGYCVFSISLQEFEAIQRNLGLVIDESRNEHWVEGCSSTDFGAPATGQIYRALTPPPPLEGNSRTSFLQMRFIPEIGRACVDLEYPYG